jgi:hypothetical protein
VYRNEKPTRQEISEPIKQEGETEKERQMSNKGTITSKLHNR